MIRIETARLLLRPLEVSDFEAVHVYARDPATSRFQPWGPNSEDETREFLAKAQSSNQEPNAKGVELAIVLRDLDRVIGSCGLHGRRLELREFEIGWTLSPEFWRRGIGSEAVRAAVGCAFRDLKAHRLYAVIDPENTPSIGLAEKLGFRAEGLQRSDRLVRAEWRDSLIYGLLESDVVRDAA